MKKNISDDKIYYKYANPHFKYVYNWAKVMNPQAGGTWYFDYSYHDFTYEHPADAIGENRIIITSNDNFVNDFVWDRFVSNVKTDLNCFAYSQTYDAGGWATSFTTTLRDAIPNFTDGSKYYPNFDEVEDFVKFSIYLYWNASTKITNNVTADEMCSNVVTLTKGEHIPGTTYENAIVYENDTKRYVCMDDKGWVCTNCLDSSVTTQNVYSAAMTPTWHIGYSQNANRKTSLGTVNYEQTLTGKMPIFGMYKEEIDMANVKNKNNIITYEKGVLSDIKLINGVPLFYEKEENRINWIPIMEDTSEDYNFYFSLTPFDDAPDPADCLEVTVDSGTPTKSPVARSGQTISFVMPVDGVVWVKWSDSTDQGGGGLCIGKSSKYVCYNKGE